MKRTTGITILALWNYLGVALTVFAGALVLLSPDTLSSIFNWLQAGLPQSASITSGKRVYVAIIFFGIATFNWYLARGLWNLQSWARTASIWLSALSLLGSTPIFIFKIVWGIMNLATIFYLSSEAVVDLFSDLKRVQNVQVSPESLRLTR